MMMMMKHVMIVTLLVLLSGLVEGQELLRGNNHNEMEMEIDYSGQRRNLAWGSGGFSWILYTMKLCNHQGHLCPGPPCGLGPRHHKWECTNNDDDTTDDTTGYTTTDDTTATGSSSGTTTTTYYDYDVTGEEDQSGNGSTTAASSFFSAMAYLAAGAAVAGIVGAIIFKKRKASAEQNGDIEGSVARRMELLDQGEALDLPGGSPPTFIEMASTSAPGASGTPTTDYVYI